MRDVDGVVAINDHRVIALLTDKHDKFVIFIQPSRAFLQLTKITRLLCRRNN